MKIISSKENSTFKLALRVAQGRKIGEKPYIWLEGIHLAQSWLDQGLEIAFLFVDEQRVQQDIEIQALMQRLSIVQVLGLNAALMRQLSQVETGQGVGALVHVPKYDLPARMTSNSLYLDRVQDPGNIGTLLRTAAAAGIKDVYLSTGCGWVWSQKVLRSAQGAHFCLRLHEGVDTQQLVDRLAMPLFATTLDKAHSLYQEAIPADVMWVFGNEGQGVSTALLELASQRVFIPQDSAVESLNVGVAAAICLFEQRRQHLFS